MRRKKKYKEGRKMERNDTEVNEGNDSFNLNDSSFQLFLSYSFKLFLLSHSPFDSYILPFLVSKNRYLGFQL